MATHTHTEKCYQIMRNCGQSEHMHTSASCYTKDGNIKCNSTEHKHSNPGCYKAIGPMCGNV